MGVYQMFICSEMKAPTQYLAMGEEENLVEGKISKMLFQ